MATSVPTAVPAIFSTTSMNSTLAHFSSLQFPAALRIPRIRNNCLKSSPRFQRRMLISAKKQSFSSFDELLEKSEKPVLVDFYATWCGPCQLMVPILEQVSASLIDKIHVVKIDTEKYPKIANKYNIEALPTFILFKDGEPSDRFEGAMPAEKLIERVEASLVS